LEETTRGSNKGVSLLKGDRRFHQLRQSGIDEELFDVISGFEALGKVPTTPGHGGSSPRSEP